MRRFRPPFRHPRYPAGAAPAKRRVPEDSAPLFTYDLRRQLLQRCPPGFAQLLGYTSQELLGLDSAGLAQLLHPESRAQWAAADFTKLLAQGRSRRWVCRLRHRDGSWRWLRLHLYATATAPNGTVQVLAGRAEDVTRHQMAVKALRQETRNLQRILSVVPTLIYVFELTGSRSLYCGPRVAELLGYSGQEILDMSGDVLGNTIPAAEIGAFREQLAEVATLRDGETRVLEYAVRHRDGSLRWLHATHTPYARDEAGRVSSVLGAAEDVTERRAADEAHRQAVRHLAAQHHLFRQVMDALPHPVYLKNEEGRYVLANKALAFLYGLTPDELVRFGVPQPPTPDLLRYNAQDVQVLRSGQDLTREDTFTRPNGEVLWFVMAKCLFVQADGTRLVLGVDTNITELKRTQLALETAKEAAEDNARAKQDFLANMSHEIRTPLHGIIGLTDVLVKTPLSNGQRDYLRLLGDSAEHLLHVLNDVLTTARLGAGKLHAEAVAFEPRTLLTSCAALLRPRARDKKLRLRIKSSPKLPAVLGDAHRLRQVLLNLVSNALKFTDTGGVLLRCQVVPAPAETPATADAALWLEFSVTDTGIGIAPEAMERIFEPFAQASSSTDREYGGSGLGLSISRGLVELLGGTLTVHSVAGQGSTFSFVVPCQRVVAPPVPEVVQPLPSGLAAGRVLVVEDNLVNSLLVETVLRNWGWQVTVAASGPMAIQLFSYRVFDVVLMDIQMPGMDGETTAEALRQHPDPARAATPIVALTARSQPGEAERLRSVGFADYLSKPFRENQLLDVLRNVCPAPGAAEPLLAYSPTLTSAEAMPIAISPPYDLSHVRQLVRNDETVLRRLSWAFIQTTPAILTALDDGLTRADWQEVSDAAHHLKSTLEGMGVEALFQPIQDLVSYAKTAPAPDVAARQVALVRDITEQVISGLRAEFPEQQ